MLIVGDAGVKIRPVADKFASEADDDISREMPGVAKKAAGFFVAAFAAVKIGGFLKDSIGEAVDLGENASKVGVVFGDMADEIEAFASTSSTALGQSKNQALEAAGTFGSLFVGMGVGREAAAGMSTDLVTLASDMASFGNATPQEALDALRAGLIGEAEPLRRFGVMLNAASIEAKAVELGLMAAGGELTDAAKSQAVYALAMEQTSIQQGDFQRTSEGLANQQRILGAQFTDLQTNIGGLFVPVLANAAGMITGTVFPALLNLTSGLPALGDALGSVGDMWRVGFAEGPEAVNAATEGLEGLPFIIGQVAGTAGDLGAIFRESLVDGAAGSALLAEDSLQGMAARAGHNFFFLGELFSSTWQTLYSSLAPVIGPVISTLTGAFSTIGATLSGAFSGGGGGGGAAFTFLTGLQSVIETVLPLVIGYVTRFAEVFQAAIPIVVTILQGLLPVVVQVFGAIGPVLSSLVPIVAQVAGVFATTLLTVLQALAPVIPPLVAAIGQVVAVLAGAFLTVLTTLAPIIPVVVGVIGQLAGILAGALAGALGAIAPVLPILAQAFAAIATAIAGALMGVLGALLPILPPIVEAFAQVAEVLVGVLMTALTAVLPIIPSLVDVLLTLFTTALVPLLPILPVIAELFVTLITAIAPLLPVVVQLAALVIQLVVGALALILPIVPVIVGLFATFIGILGNVATVVVSLVGVFVSFAASVISVIVGFVSTVVGAFTGFVTSVGQIVGGIVGVVVSIFTGITSTVVGIVTGLAGTVGGLFTGLRDAVLRIFGGIGSAIGGAFSGAVGVVRGAINGVIGVVNGAIGGLNALIDTANRIPFVDIPRIGRIPTLHEGGIFDSGASAGEGLALLRDQERVVTPEQRVVADNLLAALLAGTLPQTPAAAAASVAGPQVHIDVHGAPGQDEREIAAHVSTDLAWQLSSGATVQVPLLGAPS